MPATDRTFDDGRRAPTRVPPRAPPRREALFHIEAVFDANGAAAARGRRFAVAALNRADLPVGLTTDVQLVVSELVTNAVLHACSPVRVGIDVLAGGVRVTVTDLSPVTPVVEAAARDAVSGRGMHVVDALVSRWGTTVRGSNKTVWFEIDTS